MPEKHALITLCRDEVAPRFDMSAEVLIVPLPASARPFSGHEPEDLAALAGYGGQDGERNGEQDDVLERRHLVLAHVSGEELCDVITRSGVSMVVCGGIEEDYYHYLRWKRIEVLCDVMGQADEVLARLSAGDLQSGDCLYKIGVSQ